MEERRDFLGSAILTTSAGLLSAIVPNYTLLLILRFLVGIGIGCGACVFIMVS
ncbi:putative major facilitator superfamily domain, MFS transporter superfamily [Helianthus annuus]|nr:putative major facilitator superfamily domain, MFS transporter superfamily [Helianthus annuus]